jgi:hypothetical protein
MRSSSSQLSISSNTFRIKTTITSIYSWIDVFVETYRHLIVETITLIFEKISISISTVIVFAFSLIWKSASFAKNLIVDSLIIRNSSAISSKNVSSIVFLNSRHVQNLIVVWNSTLLTMKTSMMRTIISINILKIYRLTLFFENISTSIFMIEFNEHSQTFHESKSKYFLISLESLNDSKRIINVLVNKTFKHRLISNDIIISVFAVSISNTFNVLIESRYDDREIKNILINHDAAIRSSKNIEQYTILKRLISNINLNKKNVSKFKFDIDSNFFINSINLNISIDQIKFHIVFVNISFLL